MSVITVKQQWYTTGLDRMAAYPGLPSWSSAGVLNDLLWNNDFM